MNSENKIIRSLWVGGSLSTLEQLVIKSFIAHGHEFHLYHYEELKNVPDGTVLKDGNKILAKSKVFTSRGSLAHFSDWFRWQMLYKLGGWWVDMDLVCVRPFNFSQEIVFGSEGAALAGANIAALKFPKNHYLCKLMTGMCANPNAFQKHDSFRIKRKKILRRIILKGKKSMPWGEAGGPRGFSRALEFYDLQKYALLFTYFYPIHFFGWESIFDSTFSEDSDLFKNTHAIHLWNEGIRRSNLNKNEKFPSNSLIEQLKSIYL